MSTSRPTTAVSRRTALAALGATGLSLSLVGLAHQALAQDATPEVGSVPRMGHPLAGPWAFPDGPYNTLTTSIEVNGLCFHYVADLGMGIGAWKTTGERTGAMVIIYQDFPDDLDVNDFFVPGHVSLGHEFKPGLAIRRLTLEVDTSGDHLTTQGTFEMYDTAGNLDRNNDEEWEAWRLVQVPGTEATPT